MNTTVQLLQHAALWTPAGRLERQSILIENQHIKNMGIDGSFASPPGAEVIDASGLVAAPGFIELQINGAFGKDFTEEPDTLWQVARDLPRYGVTTFLPTVITSPLETVEHAIRIIKQLPDDFHGAQPLGLHLEGPFLNPARKGAHNPHYIVPADPNLIRDWSLENGVRLVTLAPELPGADELIRLLTSRGVVVSAGHSMATYDQAIAAFENGIRYGTHLFNAMPPLEHRAPNLPGALLTSPHITIGILPDGIHVHPAVIQLIWAAKGWQRTTIVTDAMAAMGMSEGQYILGDYQVQVANGTARLADGTLAGSILSQDQALRNLIAFTGCTLGEALATITSTPAELLSLTDRGTLKPGAIADIVLLTPDGVVQQTIARGETLYRLS